MANTVIQLKHSTLTGNVPVSLANGEISINSKDGKFFYSTPDGTIITHYPFTGPAGLNQEVQFNDNGTLNSDSGLTYNKTTDVLTVVGGIVAGGLNVSPTLTTAYAQANTANTNATNAGSYANSAFGKANTAAVAANTPSHVANSAASYANSAFGRANTAAVAANTPSHVANSAASYANSAFVRANNSLDANNGGTVTGTITATSFITSGSFGNITGANTIYANNFVANTGFIQFADGSKQYTANAGSGSGGSSNSFSTISNTTTELVANSSNTLLTIVGESGIAVAMNSSINQITIAANYIGAQGLTVDYGFVYEPTYYGFDYGTL